jgi:hypothetical protein
MTKKTPKQAKSTPPEELISDAKARAVFEVSDGKLLSSRVTELVNVIWQPQGIGDEELRIKIVRAVELFNSLKPADGAESMLAQQMVGTHSAALECLRRAALADQTFAGRDMALKHAHKLMTLYTQQLAALNKHRGKGQQKVTVEHVHVEAGGQAIVGTVETNKPAIESPPPREIEHKAEAPVDFSAKAKTPAKKG